MHLSGLSQFNKTCLCDNFYASLHVKVFHHRDPGYPRSRPVRKIKDCFASFLQTDATPPLLHSYWSAVYINITLWHASTSRRLVIGCFGRVNHVFFLIQAVWEEEKRGCDQQFTGRCASSEEPGLRRRELRRKKKTGSRPQQLAAHLQFLLIKLWQSGVRLIIPQLNFTSGVF